MIDIKLRRKFDKAVALIQEVDYNLKKLLDHDYVFLGQSSGEGAYLKDDVVIKQSYITRPEIPSLEDLPPTVIVKKEGQFWIMVQAKCEPCGATPKELAE